MKDAKKIGYLIQIKRRLEKSECCNKKNLQKNVQTLPLIIISPIVRLSWLKRKPLYFEETSVISGLKIKKPIFYIIDDKINIINYKVATSWLLHIVPHIYPDSILQNSRVIQTISDL